MNPSEKSEPDGKATKLQTVLTAKLGEGAVPFTLKVLDLTYFTIQANRIYLYTTQLWYIHLAWMASHFFYQTDLICCKAIINFSSQCTMYNKIKCNKVHDLVEYQSSFVYVQILQ